MADDQQKPIREDFWTVLNRMIEIHGLPAAVTLIADYCDGQAMWYSRSDCPGTGDFLSRVKSYSLTALRIRALAVDISLTLNDD